VRVRRRRARTDVGCGTEGDARSAATRHRRELGARSRRARAVVCRVLELVTTRSVVQNTRIERDEREIGDVHVRIRFVISAQQINFTIHSRVNVKYFSTFFSTRLDRPTIGLADR
jgi:hypothetical protein